MSSFAAPGATAWEDVALSSGDFQHHVFQPRDVIDNQLAAALIDEPGAREIVILAGHCLAMCADSAGDIGVGRRGHDSGRVVIVEVFPRETQELGMNAISHRQRAELEYPL